MRILIFSGVFFPTVGGMETVTDALAREFVRSGHEVRLITPARLGAGDAEDYDARFPYRVVRAPSAGALWGHVKWCDVYYQSNAGAKHAWPLLLTRRPWVIEYMLWRFGEEPGAPLGWKTRALIRVLRRGAWHLGGSRAVARALPFPAGHVAYVPTPFRSGIFRVMPDVPRDRHVVFAGRVIRSKGVGTLLEALAMLKARGRAYTATIVGRGADVEEFRAQCARLGLDGQVTFAGLKVGEEFVRELNRHEVMAVPSLAYETFGAVAVEGVACGCAVVGSDAGGLPEAVGACGLIFPRGDAAALADRLEALLTDRAKLEECRRHGPAHLEQFRVDVAAEARLAVFQKLVAAGTTSIAAGDDLSRAG